MVGPLWLYRFYLARQRKLLGQSTDLCWEINSFLDSFRYDSIDACVHDTSRMTAILCATLAGGNPTKHPIEQIEVGTYKVPGAHSMIFLMIITVVECATLNVHVH